MAVYFTSDTHFGHGAARGLFGRPFPTTGDMDRALIGHWNAVVGPGDTVWHLGDVAVCRDATRLDGYLATLNGTKHLIAGNNDGPATRTHPAWASVADYAEITVGEVRLVLCHYPLRAWNGQHKGPGTCTSTATDG